VQRISIEVENEPYFEEKKNLTNFIYFFYYV